MQRLIESLDAVFHDSPEAVARAWEEEIARRIADCDAGRTQGIPLEQARAEIHLLLRQHAKA
jgi:putative addiction module component (TIGR02574 family)